MKSGRKLYYVNKGKTVKGLRRAIREVVDDCLLDIAPYLVTDILNLLRKKGLVYAKKQKKNKAKSKKKTKK